MARRTRTRPAPTTRLVPLSVSGLITEPAHWGAGSWYIASARATRLYLASVGIDTSPHLLLVAVLGTIEDPLIETDPFVELERFEAAVRPILNSLDVSKVTFN
jgi:hypothetical protein